MQSLTAALSSLGVRDLGGPATNNAVDLYRAHLTKLIAGVTGASEAAVYPAIQFTQSLDKGDLSLATRALRLKGSDPNELAQKLQNEVSCAPAPLISLLMTVRQFPDTPLMERPVADRAFVQFYFKPAPLASLVLPLILELGADYGRDLSIGLRDPADASQGRRRIVVDFGSPNIAKPFHAGHLRSTIIGGFIANLYEQANWEVVRLNYLGDWGKQYGVLGVAFSDFGSEEELLRDPINHLFHIYVKASAIAREQQVAIKEKEARIVELRASGKPADALAEEVKRMRDESVDERARRYFKRMCDGESEELALWKRFREQSIQRYKETFTRLNINYDVYDGESQIKDSSMEAAAKILEERGLSEESQGAQMIDLTKYSKKLGKAIVRKKDGTSIYLTRDIGAVFERYESYHYDKMIYVIANQQDLHMAQLIKIIELMGREDLSKRLQHINFGLVLGMSTRRGTVRFLDDILRDTADKMHEVMRVNDAKYAQVKDPEKTADILGISAVIVQDMSGKRYVALAL
jgi:arginyl-tRNA synthetase